MKFCDNSKQRVANEKDGLELIELLETELHNASVTEEKNLHRSMENDHLGKQIEQIFENTEIMDDEDEDIIVDNEDDDSVIVERDDSDIEDEGARRGNIHHLSIVDIFKFG